MRLRVAFTHVGHRNKLPESMGRGPTWPRGAARLPSVSADRADCTTADWNGRLTDHWASVRSVTCQSEMPGRNSDFGAQGATHLTAEAWA